MFDLTFHHLDGFYRLHRVNAGSTKRQGFVWFAWLAWLLRLERANDLYLSAGVPLSLFAFPNGIRVPERLEEWSMFGLAGLQVDEQGAIRTLFPTWERIV